MSDYQQLKSGVKRSPDQGERPLTVIGLGQAGINIVDQVVLHGSTAIECLAVDTDQQTIAASVVGEKILLGTKIVHGLGCMGDHLRARQIWRGESATVEALIHGRRTIILVAGLGGGTGSGLALELARKARAAQIRVLVVGLMPFNFEASLRKETATRALAELRSEVDGLMVLANDRALLWPCSQSNIRQGCHVLNQLVAQGVETLSQLLQVPGMTPLEWADVQALFGTAQRGELAENCWIGSAEAEADGGVESLVQKTLESPLFLHPKAWEMADSCLACLSGGRDLALGDLQKLTKVLEQHLGGRLSIRLGAKLDAASQGRLKLTLLMADTKGVFNDLVTEKTSPPVPLPIPTEVVAIPIEAEITSKAPEPVVASATIPVAKIKAPTEKRSKPKPKVESVLEEEVPSIKTPTPVEVIPETVIKKPTAETGKKKASRQEELPFENNRGRFDKSLETMYRGENLDQPTYRRQKLVIKV